MYHVLMRHNYLVTFLADSTGFGPMIFQTVDRDMVLGGEPLKRDNVGLYLSGLKIGISDVRYVRVLVGERIGYVREKFVQHVPDTAQCL